MTTADSSTTTSYINVNNLVLMCLKIVVRSELLHVYIKSMRLKTDDKDSQIKLKAQWRAKYCEWIYKDDDQDEYKQIGYSIDLVRLSNHREILGVHTGLLKLTVSASKVCGLPLTLYNDEDYTDFHLSCAEGKVSAHRACLASRSDVFKNMLSQEWKETKEGQIQMPGVSLQTLQNLKRYLYLGVLPDDDLQSLLLFASCYLIDDLKAECISKLIETVKPEELYSLFKFAFDNELPELTFAIMSETPEEVIEDAKKIHVNKNVNEDINKE